MRPNAVERLTARLRRQPIVTALLAIGLVIVWVATFTDAVRKIGSAWSAAASYFGPGTARADVAGRWRSDELHDVRTQRAYRYELALKNDGDRVYGSARRVIVGCAPDDRSGICEGQGREIAVADGRLDRADLSFTCDWGDVPGAAPWTWVRLKERFRGKVDGRSMRLVMEDDADHPPVELVMTPAPADG